MADTATLPRAILFDLDDTILNDTGGSDECWRLVCAETAAPMLDTLALEGAIMRVRDWYWSDTSRHREGRLSLGAARRRIVRLAVEEVAPELRDAEALIERVAAAYETLREEGQVLFPDAAATLDRLRGHGVRLALLTNGAGPAQRAKLARFNLERHFDHIHVEGEHPYGKPDPRTYRRALAALRTEPCEAWMIGDNLEWDVAAPQRLGLAGIWVDYVGAGLPADSDVRPDRIIRSIRELA